MAFELHILHNWLHSLFSGDEALMLAISGAYRDKAPQKKPMPFVIWNVQAANDLPVGCGRHMAQVTVQVKVVSEGGADMEKAKNAAARLDTLLSGVNASSEAYRIVASPVGVVDYLEPDDTNNRFYRHEGRLWRFSVTPQFG